MYALSHPASQSVHPAAAASAAGYYEKPILSFGALRAAVLGLLAVGCLVGSLLLHWLHTPATAAAGPPVRPVSVIAR